MQTCRTSRLRGLRRATDAGIGAANPSHHQHAISPYHHYHVSTLFLDIDTNRNEMTRIGQNMLYILRQHEVRNTRDSRHHSYETSVSPSPGSYARTEDEVPAPCTNESMLADQASSIGNGAKRGTGAGGLDLRVHAHWPAMALAPSRGKHSQLMENKNLSFATRTPTLRGACTYQCTDKLHTCTHTYQTPYWRSHIIHIDLSCTYTAITTANAYRYCHSYLIYPDTTSNAAHHSFHSPPHTHLSTSCVLTCVQVITY